MKEALIDAAKNGTKSAQQGNILAARILAETVRSTLGPKGMDKVLVDEQNNITITNDGATILREISSEHPVAHMITEIAQSQEAAVGDGTTSAVLLAGELLKSAENLLEKRIHPTVIIKGYKLASEHALSVLQSESKQVDTTDKELLFNVAQTAMTGKGAESHKESLANHCVDIALNLGDKLNSESVTFIARPFSDVLKTEIVKGIVLEKPRVQTNMPLTVENAKIALFSCPIELRQTDIEAKLHIQNPAQLQAFLDEEERGLRKLVSHCQEQGVTALFTTKGIDDLAQQYLAQAGIYAVRRVSLSQMNRLTQATGCKVLNAVSDLTPEHLGSAGSVKEVMFGEDRFTFLTNTPSAHCATFFVHGPTIHICDEIIRALEDALGDLRSVIQSKSIVGGAGAIEVRLAQKVTEFAKTFSGKEQLAVSAFAQSMEVIPQTIAENAGLDPIDVVSQLHSANSSVENHMGLDIVNATAFDAIANGIVEPIEIKRHAIIAASEVAMMILRIDDILFTGPVATSMPDKIQQQMQQPPGV